MSKYRDAFYPHSLSWIHYYQQRSALGVDGIIVTRIFPLNRELWWLGSTCSSAVIKGSDFKVFNRHQMQTKTVWNFRLLCWHKSKGVFYKGVGCGVIFVKRRETVALSPNKIVWDAQANLLFLCSKKRFKKKSWFHLGQAEKRLQDPVIAVIGSPPPRC